MNMTKWVRSIPAYAGEPGRSPGLPAAPAVYPRVCGGTALVFRKRYWSAGLSPRMRGNPWTRSNFCYPPGSIPAYAGEPRRRPAWRGRRRVYPRVCGGTMIRNGGAGVKRGLSPRMRGNRVGKPAPAMWCGSIPAYAGEPAAGGDKSYLRRVYPRVCGGTRPSNGFCSGLSGLSPRMRGNLAPHAHHPYPPGSIPAYAGEPAAGGDKSYLRRVYPRVCGGTARLGVDVNRGVGLSPRMRGNPYPNG